MVLTTGVLLILLHPRVGSVFDVRVLKGFARSGASCVALVLVVVVFNLIIGSGIIYNSRGNTAADVTYLLAAAFFGITAYGWASLGLNKDLTLYFFKNWRIFFGLSDR